MKTQTDQTKHTSGPWFCRGTHIHYQQNPGGYRFDIAEAFRDVGAEPAAANARLIAAAPELLVMLQRLLDEICTTEDGMRHVALLTLEQARTAIAKAEGRS